MVNLIVLLVLQVLVHFSREIKDQKNVGILLGNEKLKLNNCICQTYLHKTGTHYKRHLYKLNSKSKYRNGYHPNLIRIERIDSYKTIDRKKVTRPYQARAQSGVVQLVCKIFHPLTLRSVLFMRPSKININYQCSVIYTNVCCNAISVAVLLCVDVNSRQQKQTLFMTCLVPSLGYLDLPILPLPQR